MAHMPPAECRTHALFAKYERPPGIWSDSVFLCSMFKQTFFLLDAESFARGEKHACVVSFVMCACALSGTQMCVSVCIEGFIHLWNLESIHMGM